MRRRLSRGRLGEFLIERGLIRAKDLERALDIQRVAGGHLGTNLLEIGAVHEDRLLEAIGLLHENATVSASKLQAIPREVSLLVPRDLVRRHSIVPFALHGNTVYIASQRPGDIHIENEVTLATSRLTRTFLGLEVRVQEALHNHHGHSLPLRFSRLTARLDGRDVAPEKPSGPATGTSSSVSSRSGLSGGATKSVSTQPGFVLESSDVATLRAGWISGSDEASDATLSETAGRGIAWNLYEGQTGGDMSDGHLSTENQDRFGLEGEAESGAEVAPVDREAIASGLADDQTRSRQASSNGATATQNSHRSPPPAGDQVDQGEDAPPPTEPFPRRPGREESVPIFGERTKRPRRTQPAAWMALLENSDDEASGPTVEAEEVEPTIASSKAIDPLDVSRTELDCADDREAVGRILMEAFRPYFRRRILLAKRADRLIGWRADGPGVRPKDLAGLDFDLHSGTPFLSIHNGSKFWMGTYRQDQGYRALSRVLGQIQAPDCLVLPLRAGSHIVGFVYCDNDEDTVTGQPLRQLLEFSEATGQAFERIIRRLRDQQRVSASAPKPKSPTDADPWNHPASS